MRSSRSSTWFDSDTFFIAAPDGLKVDEYLCVGFIFEEGDNIGVEIEANFHADAEEYDVLGLGDDRIDERRYGNNTDALGADSVVRSGPRRVRPPTPPGAAGLRTVEP